MPFDNPDTLCDIHQQINTSFIMSKAAGNHQKGTRSHPPLLPQKEIQSYFQALTLFVPMVIIYVARHLTVGSYIRLRRIVLRKRGRVYYV